MYGAFLSENRFHEWTDVSRRDKLQSKTQKSKLLRYFAIVIPLKVFLVQLKGKHGYSCVWN